MYTISSMCVSKYVYVYIYLHQFAYVPMYCMMSLCAGGAALVNTVHTFKYIHKYMYIYVHVYMYMYI